MAAAAHNMAAECGHLLRLGADRSALAVNGMSALDFAELLKVTRRTLTRH